MKASIYIAASLDGFIARENGKLDWLPGSDGQAADSNGGDDFGFQTFLDSVDVLVMGRKSFEMVEASGQWPYAKKRVIVLSNTLSRVSEDLSNKVEIKSGSCADITIELYKSGAKHLYIDGGKTIHGFLKAALIHEIIITTVPVLIGKGIPLFGPLERDQNLKHIATHTFNNGFVQSIYKVIV